MPGATRWPNGQRRGTREAAWDNLLLGLRLGDGPRDRGDDDAARGAAGAAPAGEAQPDGVVTRGRTQDNAGNLPPRFLAEMERQFGGHAARRGRNWTAS